jgi:4-nitrophenyl phosphatase
MMLNKFSREIVALILDVDGVIWKDDQPIGNLTEIFTEIKRRNWQVVLATNNSTRTVDQYLEKLMELGVSLEKWQIINSAQTVSAYLRDNIYPGSSIYMIGGAGLAEAILEQGFMLEDAPNRAAAVVVGMDRNLTYEKLKDATLLIRAGAAFIGSNPDKTFPTPTGLVPGAGSILAALEAATNVTPIITGKPNPEIYRIAMERLGSSPEKTLVVGDRLETDILGAQTCGCCTAIVLSGVSTKNQAFEWQPPVDIIADNLNQLVFDLL